MTENVIWEDPPLDGRRRHPAVYAFVEALRTNPGRWGKCPRGDTDRTPNVGALRRTYKDIEFVARRINGKTEIFGRCKGDSDGG